LSGTLWGGFGDVSTRDHRIDEARRWMGEGVLPAPDEWTREVADEIRGRGT
jgi:hypothetical protein